MTLDQFVNGALGALVPFLVQLIRNHVVELNGRAAVLLAAAISIGVTAIGYYRLDPTPSFGELATNAGLCFATAQAVYNSLEKARLDRLVGGAKEPESEAEPEAEQ